MKISFNLNYHTQWGESLHLCGDLLQLGGGDAKEALPMRIVSPDTWSVDVDFDGNPGNFNYFFIVKSNEGPWRFEWGKPHRFISGEDIDKVMVFDSWQDMPRDKPYYSSAFVDGILMRRFRDQPVPSLPGTLQLRVSAPMIEPDEAIAIAGGCDYLGNWDPAKAPVLNDSLFPEWTINLPLDALSVPFEYKFLIVKKDTHEAVAWETINNRVCGFIKTDPATQIVVDGLRFANPRDNWKGAGTAIPVFSIRTGEDFGVGDFYDLKKMVDWCVRTGQKVLQVLPINDTTKTGSWIDSYPYSANSTFALHPMYMRLEAVGTLADEKRREHFHKVGMELNELKEIDYEVVNKAKEEYLREIFAQKGLTDLKTGEFKKFFENNEEWLKPYAAWRVLCRLNQTPDNTLWGDMAVYDAEKVEEFCKKNDYEIKFHYFVQYHLDRQLSAVRDYAHLHGVVLKGDIPIGIGRFSVDAWQRPNLLVG